MRTDAHAKFMLTLANGHATFRRVNPVDGGAPNESAAGFPGRGNEKYALGAVRARMRFKDEAAMTVTPFNA
jgi:hypothetical protein